MIKVNAILKPAQPFQLMPPLTEDECSALKADIQTNGVMVPSSWTSTA
jgi:hypothetical protein